MRGAHLVRIESGDENRFVEDYIKQLNGKRGVKMYAQTQLGYRIGG